MIRIKQGSRRDSGTRDTGTGLLLAIAIAGTMAAMAGNALAYPSAQQAGQQNADGQQNPPNRPPVGNPPPPVAAVQDLAAQRLQAVQAAQKLQIAGQLQAGRLQVLQNNARGLVLQFPTGGALGQSGGITFPQDRGTLRNLRLAQQMVADNNFADAAVAFGAILEMEEDFFFQPDEDEGAYTSIKGEVRRMIGALPPEGLAAYRLRFEADAAKMLENAIAANDFEELTHVAARFFHTEAGYDATYLLGVRHLDQGQPLAAAVALSHLLAIEESSRARYEPGLSLQVAMAWNQSGMTEKAIATLAQLRESRPGAMVNLGDSAQPIPSDDAQLAGWLANLTPAVSKLRPTADQWAIFGGDPTRNAQANGGMPILNRQWEARAADNVSQVEEVLKRLAASNARQQSPRLPAVHPICVNGTYIFRGPLGLVAIDAATGKRLWNGTMDQSIAQYVRQTSGAIPSDASRAPQPQTTQSIELMLAQRTWTDLTHGAISSDGTNVYSIEETSASLSSMPPNSQQLPNGLWLAPNGTIQQGQPSRSTNRLRAYGLANQGKLMREWPLSDEDGPLAGAFFLGPPLPLGDTLFALAELGGTDAAGSLALVAIDPHVPAEDGVLWVQTLGVTEGNLATNPLRRMGGLSPSFAEGVLVCPTGNGAVVGFDLMSRSLSWGFTYPMAPLDPRYYPLVGWGVNVNGRVLPTNEPGAADSSGWVDNTVIIADGKAIITARDSSQLHCIDLFSGKSAWGETKVPRDRNRYVAGVVDDAILLVGDREVQALGLDDGQPRWRHQLPDNRYPAGRGFFNGGQYHLPLSMTEISGETRGEIAVVDLASRSVVVPKEQTERPSHIALGNLICYEGAVFSQNALGAQRFDRYEDLMRRVTARLRDNPDDVAALLQKGGLLLHESRFDEAVDTFRHAHEVGHTEQTRTALLDALLDGLDAEFDGYRGAVDELRGLVQTDVEKARLFRTLGDKLDAAGEAVAAFDSYMELSSIDARGVPLHSLTLEWLVRPDRWLRGQLSDLYDRATPQEREQMDAALAARLDDTGEETIDDLRRRLDYFGNLAAADHVRRRLVAALFARVEALRESERTFHEIESLLQELATSSNKEYARTAFVDLAELYSRLYLTSAAPAYLNELVARYKGVPLRGDLTGQQLAQQFRSENYIRETEYTWPQGKVESKTQSQPGLDNGNRRYPMPVDEVFRSVMGPLDFQIAREHVLMAMNEFGKAVWNARLGQEIADSHVMLTMARSGQRLGAVNHMAVIWTGNHLVGIDAMGDERGGDGRDIVWIMPLVREVNGSVEAREQIQAGPAKTLWGETRISYTNAAGHRYGSRPVMFGRQVVVMRGSELVAVDPLTGSELWIRRGFPQDSDIFGDDSVVYVATAENLSARAFDAVTGEELPGVAVPRRANRIAHFGAQILHWEAQANQTSVALLDVLTGRELWRHQLDKSAKARLTRSYDLVALDALGRLTVIDLSTGEKRFETQFAGLKDDFDFTVFVDEVRYLVGVTHTAAPETDGSWAAVAAGHQGFVIFGQLVAIDRNSGKQLWEQEVDGLGIVESQPAGGPGLILGGNWTMTNPRRGRVPIMNRSAVAAIDKRDGSIRFRHNAEHALTNANVFKNPHKGELQFDSDQYSFNLVWTDEANDGGQANDGEQEHDLILRPGDND